MSISAIPNGGPAGSRALHIFFLHHSTGRILIREGGVRKLFAQLGEREGVKIELWDHDYNAIGLSGPDGEKLGISWDIPGDNTNTDGFEMLFTQPVHDPPDNALSRILEFDVVVFKPCFPVCAIRSEEQLEQYKRHYLAVREALARHPDKLFIALTPPPLSSIPVVGRFMSSSEQWTNRDDARRARRFATWMTSPEFRGDASNIVTFDLFNMLAEPETAGTRANTLRAGFRSGKRGVIGLDSHPNTKAARLFAPRFVDFVWHSVQGFQSERLGTAVGSLQTRV